MRKDDKKLTRREFIATTGAVGAGAVLASTVGPSAAAEKKSMPTRVFGKTGVEIPILTMGTAFPLTPPLLNAALAEGINYIDTAQSYVGGKSEKMVGNVLAKNGRREECFIVTKCTEHDSEAFTNKLDGSLESLKMDAVDLYYLHNLGDPDRLDKEMMQTAERLKKSGKIRFFGFSSHHGNQVATLEKAAEVGYVDAIMFKYNFRDYDNDALNKAIDKCHKANIGLMAMKTQGGAVSFQGSVDKFKAKGFNQHQATLKAVWADERIHGAVSAMKNIKQVKENAEAARNSAMGFEERELLREYAAETDHLYCRGCSEHCEVAMEAPLQIAETLRYRMYYENYGERRRGKELFAQLPTAAKKLEGVDFTAAEAACPYKLPIGQLMQEAVQKLA